MKIEDKGRPGDLLPSKARDYLESTDHVSGPDLEAIRKLAASIFPSLTVDVATGPGHALRAAAPFSGNCVALDISFEMLQTARDHFTQAGLEDIVCLRSTADRLPLISDSVSLLTCRIAPHHFPSVPGFLDEIRRVLKADGRGVIVDNLVPADSECDRFLNETEQFRDASHVRAHTREQWLKFLGSAGLEVLSSSTFERTHPFQEWARRTGMDDEGLQNLERRFLKAPERVRKYLRLETDEKGRVLSYTDEKGIWIVKKR